MKPTLWVLILSLFLGGPARAEQPAFPTPTNVSDLFAALSPSQRVEIRVKAENGDPAAQCLVAVQYFIADHSPEHYVEGAKWARKSAEQGFAVAQGILGTCYHSGTGVSQDYAEAVKWLRKSADQGNSLAQWNLGGCYANGEGVIKDCVQAYKWDTLAFGSG